MSDFGVHPMSTSVLDQARAGEAAEHLIAGGGEPLRCCLRRAEAGEKIMLFAYQLPLPPTPYGETGPVYAHAELCAGPSEPGFPAAFLDCALTLRAYDADGRIHPATRLHDGRDPEREIGDVLAEPGVVQVHVRNPSYGCYLFAVTRE
jgi:hypothetical protein